MSFLTSDEAVADFQRFFGVVKTSHAANSTHSNETPGSRHLNQNNSLATEQSRYRLRNRDVPLDQNDTANSKIIQDHAESNVAAATYEIRSQFWYYVFNFGANLCAEEFFVLFIPLCSWNFSIWLVRRVIYVWLILAYFGQGAKDLIKLPRPNCPPVIRLDTVDLFQNEYGMPSTHAMIGTGVAMTIVMGLVERYQFPFIPGLVIIVIWSVLVSSCRLYLGMHNVLDIIAGLLYCAIVMVVLMPYLDTIDHYFAYHPNTLWNTAIATIIIAMAYPAITVWNSSRELTTIVCGVAGGFLMGSWLRIEYGIHPLDPLTPPPYDVPSVELYWAIRALIRSVIGIILLILTRTVSKATVAAAISVVLRVPYSAAKKTDILAVELVRKYTSYYILTFLCALAYPKAYVYFNLS